MKKILATLMLCVFTMGASSAYAGGEIDILVDKLVQKGVLSPTEAQIILDETKKEVAMSVAKGKSYGSPAWSQKIKLKGDFRARYQVQQKENKANRDRGRVRFRLGAQANVAEKTKVYAGIATGGDDPRSTNETLDNSFETGDMRLDYAYAKHQINEAVAVKLGKIKKTPFWKPSDLLWDGDINPEGVALSAKCGNMFLNTAVLILDEIKKDTSDPFLFVFQPGVKVSLGDGVSLKGALTYYGFENVKGNAFDHSAGTNSLDDDVLMYDYDSFGGAVQLDVKNPLNLLPYFALIGEYNEACDPSEENSAYMVGFKLGHKKVKKPGRWQIKYMYKELEKDAFVDFTSDSDFYGGDTGAKGHELAFKYALKKKVILGLDYYNVKPIGGGNKEELLQVDMVYKF